MRISIILVGWNSLKDIDACIKSIKQQTFKKFNIIYVDNNSRDKSCQHIKKKYKTIDLIENPKNEGFAEGCNIGIRRALKKNNPDYICLLNIDTELDKNCLKNLVRAVESKRDIGAATPKILYFHDRKKINVAGLDVNYLGYSWGRGFNKKDAGQFRQEEVASGSGCCLLVKSKIFKEIEFDKSMFAYCEDTDFCWRLRLLGHKITFVPESIVYHKYRTSKITNKFREYLLDRNRLIAVIKNYRVRTLILITPVMILNEFGVLFYAWTRGWAGDKIRGYAKVFSKSTKSDRMEIQQSRRISDAEITKIFKGGIDYPISDSILFKIHNSIIGTYWKIIKRII